MTTWKTHRFSRVLGERHFSKKRGLFLYVYISFVQRDSPSVYAEGAVAPVSSVVRRGRSRVAPTLRRARRARAPTRPNDRFSRYLHFGTILIPLKSKIQERSRTYGSSNDEAKVKLRISPGTLSAVLLPHESLFNQVLYRQTLN